MEFAKVKELVREKNAEYESRRKQLEDAQLRQLNNALYVAKFPEGSEVADIDSDRVHVHTEDAQGKEVLIEALSVTPKGAFDTPPIFESEEVYISVMYGDFNNCIDLRNFTNEADSSWSGDGNSLIVKVEDAPLVMRELVDWVHEYKN